MRGWDWAKGCREGNDGKRLWGKDEGMGLGKGMQGGG